MILNKIYCENCLDTMAKMPDRFIDLTVTSPPYDNLRDYKGYTFDFEAIAKELYRVTKIGGVVVWVVNDATINGSETGTSFKQALYFKEIGFNLHDTMIFLSDKPPENAIRYQASFEFMFIFSKGKPKTFNPIKEQSLHFGRKNKTATYYKKDGTKKLRHQGDIKQYKIKSNVWKYQTGKDGLHPATFPEQLAADHIYTWSNENDLIYDCFGGSGTVAKIAHLQKRNWILSEISSKYCDISQKRIQPYLDQQTIKFE